MRTSFYIDHDFIKGDLLSKIALRSTFIYQKIGNI